MASSRLCARTPTAVPRASNAAFVAISSTPRAPPEYKTHPWRAHALPMRSAQVFLIVHVARPDDSQPGCPNNAAHLPKQDGRSGLLQALL